MSYLFRNALGKSKPISEFQKLIDRGYDVNDTELGQPLLFGAIIYNRVDVCKLLIKNGVHIDVVTSYHHGPPLIFALEFVKIEVVKLLLKHGVSVNCEHNNKECDVLTLGVMTQDPEICKILIQQGVNIGNTTRNPWDIVPIYALVSSQPRYHPYNNIQENRPNRLEIARLLLRMGGWGWRKDGAAEHAKQRDFPEMAELIENWPRINALEDMCRRVIYTNREIIPEWFPPLLLEL